MKIRIVLAVAVAATAATVVLPAVPAWASTRVCETYGKYCVDSSGLSSGDPVNEGGGRQLIRAPVGSYYVLVFADDQTKCVGISGNGYLEVRDCSSGLNAGVDWIRQANGSSWTYKSPSYFPQAGPFYLSGDDHGDRMFVTTWRLPGARQKFTALAWRFHPGPPSPVGLHRPLVPQNLEGFPDCADCHPVLPGKVTL